MTEEEEEEDEDEEEDDDEDEEGYVEERDKVVTFSGSPTLYSPLSFSPGHSPTPFSPTSTYSSQSSSINTSPQSNNQTPTNKFDLRRRQQQTTTDSVDLAENTLLRQQVQTLSQKLQTAESIALGLVEITQALSLHAKKRRRR